VGGQAAAHPHICRDVGYFGKSTMVRIIFLLARAWQKSASTEEYHIKVPQSSPYTTSNPQAAVPLLSRNSLGKTNVLFHKISAEKNLLR